MQTQSEAIEESIWVSVRMLEERRNLLLIVSQHDREMGNNQSGTERKKRAEEMNIHIERLKTVLQTIRVHEPNE